VNSPRRATLQALAKLNLSLKVLHKRTDGYHEIRTVFQTISLADTLHVEYEPSPRTDIALQSSVDIPDNLAAKAARMVLDAMRLTGRIRVSLEKRIPMGSGLGGGSSDAASILLALPALAGSRLPMPTLARLAGELGSDVPFFLHGGTALGLGRGEELYPLEGPPPAAILLVAPKVSVSTQDAYRALDRRLTSDALSSNLNTFQSFTWSLQEGLSQGGPENDFEEVVFRQHPPLKRIKSTLLRSGAKPALMTGSGSAIFGIFGRKADVENARRVLRKERLFSVLFVNRGEFRSLWWRQLRAHVKQKLWPPPSRYVP
jgi:4-diphosphocytidyl-2-C-methyl-D-erythritol kinase